MFERGFTIAGAEFMLFFDLADAVGTGLLIAVTISKAGEDLGLDTSSSSAHCRQPKSVNGTRENHLLS